MYIPECPPRPQALLEGILLAIDKVATMADGQVLKNICGMGH